MTEAKPLSQEEVNAACHAVPPETKVVIFLMVTFPLKIVLVFTFFCSRIFYFSKPCTGLKIQRNPLNSIQK